MMYSLDAPGRPKAHPVIEWIGGPRPYIWIGDEANGECYATGEPAKMAAIARRILKAVEGD